MRVSGWYKLPSHFALPQGWSSVTTARSLSFWNDATTTGCNNSSNSTTISRSFSSSSTTTHASDRGQRAVQLLPTYLADARSVQKYSSDQHPNGALQLGVAESKLIEDWLLPAINKNETPLDPSCIYYQPTQGREGLRIAMAGYMEELLELPRGRIDHQGIIVGAGCNAVLENLCFCLAEAGDAVLIPTPYYAAFEFDLAARAALAIQPVNTRQFYDKNTTAPTLYYPNRRALDAAYQKAIAKGHPPKILLLSHPQNPLGICYPPSVMQECIDWCRERKIHLISDEIYAGSVYQPDTAHFESALKIAPDLGPYVHWVYALSKDFCLSGLRVGVAYSENQDIRLPMQKLNDMCQISSQTQVWTQSMLTRSDQWVNRFRRENHERLRSRCARLTALLDECNIPYLTPTAGLFLWIDMSQFLTEHANNDEERERSLYLKLVHEFGLLLTPGKSMRNEQPGFFRCVFTAATDEEFTLCLERFRAFAKSHG